MNAFRGEIKAYAFIFAALVSGAAIGYCLRTPASDLEGAAPPADSSAAAGRKIADVGEAARIRALKRRVAELEQLLAERQGETDEAISNAVAAAAKPAFARPPASPRAWLQKLKETDPARYQHITNRIARGRQRRLERARSRIDFLSSVDTSRMSAGAKKTHDTLQELIARREELEEQLHQDDLSNDERRQILQQMRETDGAMRKLNGEERRNLVSEMAKGLGFEGEAVQEISETMMEVFEATNDNGRGGMPPEGEPPPNGESPPNGGPPPDAAPPGGGL